MVSCGQLSKARQQHLALGGDALRALTGERLRRLLRTGDLDADAERPRLLPAHANGSPVHRQAACSQSNSIVLECATLQPRYERCFVLHMTFVGTEQPASQQHLYAPEVQPRWGRLASCAKQGKPLSSRLALPSAVLWLPARDFLGEADLLLALHSSKA